MPTLFCVMARLLSPRSSLVSPSVKACMPRRGRYSLSSVGSELIWASIVLTTGSTHGLPSSVLKAERKSEAERKDIVYSWY